MSSHIRCRGGGNTVLILYFLISICDRFNLIFTISSPIRCDWMSKVCSFESSHLPIICPVIERNACLACTLVVHKFHQTAFDMLAMRYVSWPVTWQKKRCSKLFVNFFYLCIHINVIEMAVTLVFVFLSIFVFVSVDLWLGKVKEHGVQNSQKNEKSVCMQFISEKSRRPQVEAFLLGRRE